HPAVRGSFRGPAAESPQRFPQRPCRATPSGPPLPSCDPSARRNTMHDRALVLGASIAGLLTARVLADHYAEVTIVERDVLPDGPAARHGVPHGRHLHGLHPRGRQILDELFPGFSSDLVAAG